MVYISFLKLPKIKVAGLLSLALLLGCAGPKQRVHDSPVGNDFVYKYYAPEKSHQKSIGVIALGGSGGGIEGASSLAAELSKYNVGALAVSYFGSDNLPSELELVSLEYVTKGIGFLQRQPSIDKNRIGILGVSKGGELALLLASKFPEIKFVIAFSPSNVVFQSIAPSKNWPRTSSWSYGNKAVDFLPYKYQETGTLFDLYKNSLEQEKLYDSAIIQVEDINGPILLFSGTKDEIWPSTWMCEKITRRLNEHDFDFEVKHLVYKNAGHIFSTKSNHIDDDNTAGGNGNSLAFGKSWNEIGDFLKTIK